MKLHTYLVSALVLFSTSLVSQTAQNPGNVQSKKSLSNPSLKSDKPFDYDIVIKAATGGFFNYQSLAVSTPVVAGSLLADLDWKIGPTFYLSARYEVEGDKRFEPVPGTTNTLDQLHQYAMLRFGFDKSALDIHAEMKYNWMIRPQWPDLYQPNPRSGTTVDPAYGDYIPTDRNSYHKFRPSLSAEYTGIKQLDLSLDLLLTRNLEYIDPNYSVSEPIHLEPTTYFAYAAELGAVYHLNNDMEIELKDKVEFRTFDYELARDAVTGKTNYRNTPNPLYTEFGNKTTLAFTWELQKLNIKIKPFAALDINEDLFQGYYSYTGIEPGIEIEHKIQKFSYKIKFSEELRYFGPSSFDPVKTTDSQALYKYYTHLALDAKYRFNKHFESFIEAGMEIKQTNYPPYVPGQNPVGKNYDIDFNYENYYVYGGASYRI